MFSFFEKKTFLVDHLHGLVDIHNHILPGIDDGAKTVEESISLIKGFSEFGIKSFVFTPHIMHHYYPNTPQTIKVAYERVKKGLLASGMEEVQIDYAAEHMIDENFENLLNKNAVLPVRKEYLLIEMSYLQPSLYFDEAILQIAKKSFFPILAHPERYTYYHKKQNSYGKMKSEGIQFQLNLLSLGGYYGSEIQRISHKLLKDGLVDFISSDVHNQRQLLALKETKISKKNLGLLHGIIDNTLMTFY
nr:CpsB/CapC family capsule biosynthesis tyrosine phosphatase [uncultured Allomuricauda sp.]